jgi:hypothetical protein
MKRPTDLTELGEIAVVLDDGMIEISVEEELENAIAILDIEQAKLVMRKLKEMIDYLEGES